MEIGNMELSERRALGRLEMAGTAFLVVGLVTLLLALLGIFTRQVGFLAAFWPANAVLVGLFIRVPSLAAPLGWVGAFVGFAIADLATGSSFTKMITLTFANFAAIGVGYLVLRSLAPHHQRLREPASIIYLFLACVAGAAAAGVAGILPGRVLFDMPVTESALTWFASELAGNMAILPVVLTMPAIWPGRIGNVLAEEARKTAVPFAFLIASLIAGLAVGGPAAVTFVVPALLYCALVAGLFPTAVLNLIATAWTMIAITSSGILLLGELPPASTVLSIQVGLSFLVMGPIAVAANVASKEEALSRLRLTAARDALTGVLTRGAFDEEAKQMMRQLAADGRPVAVLMLDIDHFKQINDSYGHQAGDHVLIEFANLASESLRDSDIIGRIGGEEFAIVLPGVRYEISTLVAERVRHLFAKQATVFKDQALEVTVSIGNAYFECATDSLSEALTVADRALYRAKQEGRNRVCSESVTVAGAFV